MNPVVFLEWHGWFRLPFTSRIDTLDCWILHNCNENQDKQTYLQPFHLMKHCLFFQIQFLSLKKPSRVCFSKKPGLQNLFSTYSGFFKASRFRGKNLVTFLTPTAVGCCGFFFWVVETHHFCQRKIGVAAVVSIFFLGSWILSSSFECWKTQTAWLCDLLLSWKVEMWKHSWKAGAGFTTLGKRS